MRLSRGPREDSEASCQANRKQVAYAKPRKDRVTEPTRMPNQTIRLRNVLRHGLRLGWRVTDGIIHPVTSWFAPPCSCECAGCVEGWDDDEEAGDDTPAG
jgi:hypothetical protein